MSIWQSFEGFFEPGRFAASLFGQISPLSKGRALPDDVQAAIKNVISQGSNLPEDLENRLKWLSELSWRTERLPAAQRWRAALHPSVKLVAKKLNPVFFSVLAQLKSLDYWKHMH